MHKRKIAKGMTHSGTTLVANSYGILVDDKYLIPWSSPLSAPGLFRGTNQHNQTSTNKPTIGISYEFPLLVINQKGSPYAQTKDNQVLFQRPDVHWHNPCPK